MSENEKLKRTDRLAIRSSVSGKPMGEKQKAKWLDQHNVTFNQADSTYSFGEGNYDSFEAAVSEVYKDNELAQQVKNKAENYGKFANFNNNLPSGLGSMIGDFASGLGSTFGNKYGEDFTEQQKATQSVIRKGLEMIPGVGHAISAVTGVVDAIGTTTGLNLSNIDKGSASKAGIGGAATFNNLMNMIPGNSMLWGMWGGDRTKEFTKLESINGMEGAFSGSISDIDAASDLGNKRLLFGKRKANDFISEQVDVQNEIASKNDLNKNIMRGVVNTTNDIKNKRNSQYYSNGTVSVGRQGLKLLSIDEINKILLSRAKTEIQEFKNGGVIGIDSSIIPEGKLHAHKHNLKDANPDLEDVTKKGIPIVTLDEGGELQQVAEIEKEEIIFRKEITTKLEELYKDGSDEAMIEAGKLIAEELMTNTDDNTEEFINEDSKN